ncbi:MAG: gliding motility-associated C-terminal domain-containing protein [Cyclobacteriaceae bacterium]|nr:gliding motility-associated C-terminal domain-containing protein [Cyclobacteriaceae bacterium]UYN86310.1 MAG: gliding motility-associated C-terminal domain-containing protein [Cyclobacteriaceae bacterium]
MRVVILSFLLLLAILPARASHIVGGEFELIHISGNTYRLNLILYFDELNGLQGAKDAFADVRIFRKRDNAIMFNGIRLFQSAISNVNYTQPECSKGEIVTSKIVYSSTVTLLPSVFNDPQGYYISWERCCRNYQIANIYSENPAFSNRNAGQTFYLEFPPVVKNGEPFINSSPRLFPPLNDYACPQKKYYVDFAGTDDDGDSLVYSLVTPLNTLTPDALPPGGLPRPGPYPDVLWRPGYSLNRITGGSPDLKISDDGFLTVTPPQTGIALYVFAVKCEEFRDGVKIGEVRRDFQMLVVDACPVAEPPQIVGRKKGSASFSQHKQPLSVTFANTVSDADRCVEVRVSDKDSEKAEDSFQEKVYIRVLPLNFKNSTRYLNELLPSVSTATLINGSVADFTICFPECPLVPGGNFQIGIIAFDDACSLPLSDTLVVNVFVQPPPNSPPQFITVNQTILINEGDPLLSIPIQAEDADLDQLDVFVLVDGFLFANVGMTLNLNPTQPGQLTGLFTWDSRCDVYDFTQKTQFKIQVIVDDRDKCLIASPDTLTFNLTIKLPGNADPVISSNLQQLQEKHIEVTKKIYETLEFTVSGADADNDFITLEALGFDFNVAEYGMVFPGDQGNGTVSSPFSWYLNCDKIDLAVKSVYELMFMVVDNANKCRFYKADTLTVVVTVEPPDNLPPAIAIASINADVPLVSGAVSVFRGQEIQLKVTGVDADVNPQDVIRLELSDATGSVTPSGYSFSSVEGTGLVESVFSWIPDCTIFQNGVFENDYTFTFSVNDGRCFNGGQQSVEVNIIIKDEEASYEEFLPPNLVTPDGNGKNEFFAMVKFENGEYVSILPKDNCMGSFVNVRIYDRWGTQVYESSNRDFRWFPKDAASGVYYYHLTYTHRQYRGSVSVKY